MGPLTSRRALLRHLWAMAQTRTEAAALVVSLQKTAVMKGIALYGVAAMVASASMTAAIVLVAVATPPEWRVAALSAVLLLLVLVTVLAAVRAGQRLRRDTALIADFSKGLRLDLAMINLALKDPEPDDRKETESRERAQEEVREAAAAKASTPSTAEGGAVSSTGPSAAATSAAIRAASPAAVAASQSSSAEGAPEMRASLPDMDAERADDKPLAGSIAAGATEREMPEPPVTPPEAMTNRPPREHTTHGRP